jgi:hypothetical protein
MEHQQEVVTKLTEIHSKIMELVDEREGHSREILKFIVSVLIARAYRLGEKSKTSNL